MPSWVLGAALAAFTLSTSWTSTPGATSIKDAVERAVLHHPEVKFKHHNVASGLADGLTWNKLPAGWPLPSPTG